MVRFIVVNAECVEAKAFCIAVESCENYEVALKVDSSYYSELDSCNTVTEALELTKPSMVVDFSVEPAAIGANMYAYVLAGVPAVFPREEGFYDEAERVLMAKSIADCRGLSTMALQMINSYIKDRITFVQNFMQYKEYYM